MAKTSSNSCERAIAATSAGSTQRIRTYIAAAAAARRQPSDSSTPTHPALLGSSAPVLRSALIDIIAMTTAKSCTIRKPTAMRPCRLSSSRLSDSSLTMMIVLENVSATATYKASMAPLPNASTSAKPITMVKVSWPRPVARATGPIWRM